MRTAAPSVQRRGSAAPKRAGSGSERTETKGAKAWAEAATGLWANAAAWAGLVVCVWLVAPKRIGEVWRVDGARRTAVNLPWLLPPQAGTQTLEMVLGSQIETVSVRAKECVETF